jgi:hypothetical protein
LDETLKTIELSPPPPGKGGQAKRLGRSFKTGAKLNEGVISVKIKRRASRETKNAPPEKKTMSRFAKTTKKKF